MFQEVNPGGCYLEKQIDTNIYFTIWNCMYSQQQLGHFHSTYFNGIEVNLDMRANVFGHQLKHQILTDTMVISFEESNDCSQLKIDRSRS
jgi:hypothetical protein